MQWRFDAPAGREEVIARRIGRNELDTIQVLKAMADAQIEYARTEGTEPDSSPMHRSSRAAPTRRTVSTGR